MGFSKKGVFLVVATIGLWIPGTQKAVEPRFTDGSAVFTGL